jgi:predicted RNase H-like HicB family nuclease
MTMKVKINTKELKFKVPIIVEPDGVIYYARSPALPGLMMDGVTEAEALQSAREGAAALLRCMIHDGDPIPLNIFVPENKTSASITDREHYHLEEIKVFIE